jgi:hypothetical protein
VRVLVFLQGTALMHPAAVGRTREERVDQVRTGADPALQDASSYIPVDGSVAKLRRWYEQGAQIAYLSAHRDRKRVAEDAAVLEKYGFPPGRVLARDTEESYGDVAGQELPDVLIEDDCESIGGTVHLTYPQVAPELRARIKSIVVPEFGGIDHLPDALEALLDFEPSANA